MEVKVNALVIRSIDYKENDKILTLYSLEKGKITAGIKGVKKAGAKLKFAQEPFTFAEFILAEKAGRYTVIGATYLDGFYNLRTNLEKYYTSGVVAEALNLLTEENLPDPVLFSVSINAIKDICYNKNERISLIKYLFRLTEILGYKIEQPACSCCGEIIKGRVFFNFRNAEFSCEECREEGFNEIRPETYDAYVKIIGGVAPEIEQDKIPPQAITMLLKFLFYYLSSKTEVQLKSASALDKITE